MSTRSDVIEVPGSGLSLLGMARMLWRQEETIFKGSASCGQPWARIAVNMEREGSELLDIPAAGGQRIKALFGTALTCDGKPKETQSAPTMLFFYGNRQTLLAALGNSSNRYAKCRVGTAHHFGQWWAVPTLHFLLHGP